MERVKGIHPSSRRVSPAGIFKEPPAAGGRSPGLNPQGGCLRRFEAKAFYCTFTAPVHKSLIINDSVYGNRTRLKILSLDFS